VLAVMLGRLELEVTGGDPSSCLDSSKSVVSLCHSNGRRLKKSSDMRYAARPATAGAANPCVKYYQKIMIFAIKRLTNNYASLFGCTNDSPDC